MGQSDKVRDQRSGILQGVPKKRVILSKIPITGLKRGLKIKVG